MIPLFVYAGGAVATYIAVKVAQVVSKRNCVDRNLIGVTRNNPETLRERQAVVVSEWEENHLQPTVALAVVWPLYLPFLGVKAVVNRLTNRPLWQIDGLLPAESVIVEAKIAEEVVAKKIETETKKRCKKEEQQRLRESV